MAKDDILARLEEGPWPSFVREMKRTETHLQLYADGIRQNYTQFGYGGHVLVPEIGAGVEVHEDAPPSTREHFALFPVAGPLMQRVRIAGLPKPSGCKKGVG